MLSFKNIKKLVKHMGIDYREDPYNILNKVHFDSKYFPPDVYHSIFKVLAGNKK